MRASNVFLLMSALCSLQAAENIMITGVPDYAWYAGCFGTAGGNMMGYWDRHGFPNFYTGRTAGGVAPLNTVGLNQGIRSMWCSKAGLDGRPTNVPGHADDYWTYLHTDFNYSYESTGPDPYSVAGRAEHEPDCIGDFVGASQMKWIDFDGECSGNIDAYAFNFWDKQGEFRINFNPPEENGVPMRDVQSGLREWTRYRGSAATVGSQLVDFNPEVPTGKGFTFENLRAEILRGYPVMLILQNSGEYYRSLPGMPRANPNIHAMLAFRFVVTDNGEQLVQYRTSWASGEANETWAPWGAEIWAAGLTLRGVIVYHPQPQITGVERTDGQVTIRWDGPSTTLHDEVNGADFAAHLYKVQRAESLGGPFVDVGEPTSEREITVTESSAASQVFYRLKLMTPAYDGMGQ